MSNQFARFYNTDVRILRITTGQGYSDSGAETITELAEIKADIQPHGGSLSEKEYGLSEDYHAIMFCDNNEHIKAGNYAEVNGRRYRIIYPAPWESGAEVFLQLVR